MERAMNLEVRWEAQGSVPHYRVDQIQPLLQGRVKIEGVEFIRDDPMVNAGFYENARFKDGDFGLLDIMWGETVPAIGAGWDLVLLPVVTKRKPVYDYLWVRADRGINGAKDLEGHTIATTGYGSAITIFTRGFLSTSTMSICPSSVGFVLVRPDSRSTTRQPKSSMQPVPERALWSDYWTERWTLAPATSPMPRCGKGWMRVRT